MAYIYYNRDNNRILTIGEVDKMTREYKDALLNGTGSCPLGLIEENGVTIENGYVVHKKTVAEIKTEEALNDPDVFVNITNKHAEERRNITALAQESAKVTAIIEEFRDYAPSLDDYNEAIVLSTTPGASQKRNGYQRFITPKTVAALFLSAGLAVGTIKMAISASELIQKWQTNGLYNAAISQIKEEGINLNAVNENKVMIPGSRDIDGSPSFYFDINGIASDILKVGDDGFDAALYYAYNSMGAFRQVGSNHNWNDVIRRLSSSVNVESSPATFNKIDGCESFDDYLIKNGFVDDNGSPDINAFITYGKNAVITYGDSLETMEGIKR